MMVPVSLYDVIEICKLKRTSNPAGARITVNCDHPLVPSGEKNIVYGAARILMQQAGADQPVHIQIHKRIPVGAGLGGGSTDAAATLIGLNRLFKLHLTETRLENLAPSLGDDVLFFMPMRIALARCTAERRLA